MEVLEKFLPLESKAVPFEVGEGKRETVVDADDGRNVLRQACKKPLGKTTARPVFAGTRRRQYFGRIGVGGGNVDAKAL